MEVPRQTLSRRTVGRVPMREDDSYTIGWAYSYGTLSGQKSELRCARHVHSVALLSVEKLLTGYVGAKIACVVCRPHGA